jgi:hypothetical protein
VAKGLLERSYSAVVLTKGLGVSLWGRGSMNLREMARTFQAVVALFALLAAGVPSLAESLTASTLPACCNTVYCPVHHRQVHEVQQDRTNCDARSNPGQNECSMRACDTTTPPVVGTSSFLLVTPLAMRLPASAEPAQIQAPRFYPFSVSIPLTPPPRALPS